MTRPSKTLAQSLRYDPPSGRLRSTRANTQALHLPWTRPGSPELIIRDQYLQGRLELVYPRTPPAFSLEYSYTSAALPAIFPIANYPGVIPGGEPCVCVQRTRAIAVVSCARSTLFDGRAFHNFQMLAALRIFDAVPIAARPACRVVLRICMLMWS